MLAAGPRVVLAGGTDLYASGTPMPAALRNPVVDITAIDALRGVRTDGADLIIGAATTWADVREMNLVPSNRAFSGWTGPPRAHSPSAANCRRSRRSTTSVPIAPARFEHGARRIA